MTSITTTNDIARFQLVALRGALRLEQKGMMRSRRPSARQIALKQSGLPGKTSTSDLIVWLDGKIKEYDDE